MYKRNDWCIWHKLGSGAMARYSILHGNWCTGGSAQLAPQETWQLFVRYNSLTPARAKRHSSGVWNRKDPRMKPSVMEA
jgi:hypothetical protein